MKLKDDNYEQQRSLDEINNTIHFDHKSSASQKFLAFLGPGLLVAVGYMDPGNWTTDIAGGSAYGYALLSVILLSNLMAIVLQALSARLVELAGDTYGSPEALYARLVRRPD